jgi:hypothetical protein
VTFFARSRCETGFSNKVARKAKEKLKMSGIFERLCKTFGGVSFSREQISAASKEVGQYNPEGYRWSVGTRGSIHYSEGFSATQAEATAACDDCFSRKIAANPAVGTFDTAVEKASTGRVWTEYCNKIAEILNR